jgi:hypothetical protein
MAILLALASEVASIRERLDTHERLADGGSLPSSALVEAYEADEAAAAEREAWRSAYIRRLFRVVTEEVEALRGPPKAAPDETS